MKVVRVVIVDLHRFIRHALCSILVPDNRFFVAGQTNDATEALELVRELKPELILLGAHQPDIDGVELCRQLKSTYPRTTIVILASPADRTLAQACVRAGARGWIYTEAIEGNIQQQLLSFVGPARELPWALDNIVRPVEHLTEILEPRQIALLRLLVIGYKDKEIIKRLGMDETTFQDELDRLYSGLGATGRVDAILKARQYGLD